MKTPNTKIFPLLAGIVGLLAFAIAAHAAPEPVKLRIELDRTVLPAETKEKVIVKVALDGIRPERASQRPPVNLAVVLDRSGSMQGDKIDCAKAAAIEALNRLAADDIFSLVVFDDKIETLIPATRVGSGEALEARIRRLQPGGSTALFGGVSQGASEIRKNLENPRYVHRIILLSDGQANVGPRTPAELGRLGTALVKEGVSVTTIGLGLDYDEDLMTRLALRSEGNTYFVEGASDLTRIFNAELGDVLSIVARRAVVTVEFPVGVKPLRFVGREGTIEEQIAEFSLNQIYGGQEKFALIEAEVPANRAGAEMKIAGAKVAFENPATQMPVNLAASQNARFSADAGAVKESANQQVLTDYGYNITALAREEAIALNDKGDYAGAANVMSSNAVKIGTMGHAYANTDLTNIAGVNTREAQIMNAGKLDNSLRKGYNMTNNAFVSQQTNLVSADFTNTFNGTLAINNFTGGKQNLNGSTIVSAEPRNFPALNQNNDESTQHPDYRLLPKYDINATEATSVLRSNNKPGIAELIPNYENERKRKQNFPLVNFQAGENNASKNNSEELPALNLSNGFPTDAYGRIIVNKTSGGIDAERPAKQNDAQNSPPDEIKSLKVLEQWFIFAGKGDTLETIAAKNNITVEGLRALNPDTDWKNIRESQLIRVKK